MQLYCMQLVRLEEAGQLTDTIRHMGDIEVIHTFEGTETMQALIVGARHHPLGAFA